MPLLRPSSSRGHAQHGWLDTWHSFSFANYYDPDWMGFGPLRVINEDRIEGNKGFGDHGHSDMEILTYVIEGALEHRDSLGSGSVIHPEEIQYMSAGTGIIHSEFNPKEVAVHVLQIWIEPNEYHAAPRYQEKKLEAAPSNQLQLLASSDGREESIAIRANADVYRGVMKVGDEVTFTPRTERKQWIQIISGELMANDTALHPGDGCGFEDESKLLLKAIETVHFLFFDLG